MDLITLRNMGLDPTLLDSLHDLLDFSDETEKSHHAPSRAYIREAKTMAATPADVKEYPNAYVFIVDMPGLKPEQVKVQIEEGNVLVVGGERKREKDTEGGKYLKMERRLGKYLKKFVLPENVNPETVTRFIRMGY